MHTDKTAGFCKIWRVYYTKYLFDSYRSLVSPELLLYPQLTLKRNLAELASEVVMAAREASLLDLSVLDLDYRYLFSEQAKREWINPFNYDDCVPWSCSFFPYVFSTFMGGRLSTLTTSWIVFYTDWFTSKQHCCFKFQKFQRNQQLSNNWKPFFIFFDYCCRVEHKYI